MTNDAISARERLARLDPHKWEHRLSMLLFALAIVLALMCENVNADWPAATIEQRSGNVADGERSARSGPQAVSNTGDAKAGSIPAGPANFTIGHPMCQTGFTIAMRFDERNAAGTIIKSVWVRKCVRVPRIVYGRKV